MFRDGVDAQLPWAKGLGKRGVWHSPMPRGEGYGFHPLTRPFGAVAQVLTVFFIFIVAFALAFFVLLNQQEGFATLATTIGKTSIMMTGEYDFDEIFRGGCDTCTWHLSRAASASSVPALTAQ